MSDDYGFVSFSLSDVLGETDGVSRQVLLRRIKFGNKPFQNSESLDVNLKPSVYNGKPSVDCYVNGILIGGVKKRREAKVIIDAMKKKNAIISAFDITGGGMRNSESHFYGVDITVRYENDD